MLSRALLRRLEARMLATSSAVQSQRVELR